MSVSINASSATASVLHKHHQPQESDASHHDGCASHSAGDDSKHEVEMCDCEPEVPSMTDFAELDEVQQAARLLASAEFGCLLQV